MGYYTKYTLTIHEGTADLAAVQLVLDKIMTNGKGSETYYDPDSATITSDGTIMWYDHDEDMAELSRIFHGVVFCLDGEGEDTGDIWKCYYKNGLCQICRSTMMFPPYDDTKLKSVFEAQEEDAWR